MELGSYTSTSTPNYRVSLSTKTPSSNGSTFTMQWTPETLLYQQQLTSPLPRYCRALYSTPHHFPANLNASCASSSGVSSRDSPSSDEDHVSKTRSPESLVSSTIDEEIVDVVNDDDVHFLPTKTHEVSPLPYRPESDSDETASVSPRDLSDSLRDLSDSLRTSPEFDRESSPPLRTHTETARSLSAEFRDSPVSELSVNNISRGTPEKGNKKPRTNFSRHQIDSMNAEFQDNPYPDSERIEEMSRELCIPESKIKVWFQNKRARFRRKVPPTPTTLPYPTPLYVPAIPHHVVAAHQGQLASPTGHLIHQQYPLMFPTMYTAPFSPQHIMPRPYYPFPAYHMTPSLPLFNRSQFLPNC